MKITFIKSIFFKFIKYKNMIVKKIELMLNLYCITIKNKILINLFLKKFSQSSVYLFI